jgi:membrane protease YdiL (CAAX protease family)
MVGFIIGAIFSCVYYNTLNVLIPYTVGFGIGLFIIDVISMISK